MKSRKKRTFKTTLSLALLSCFGFAPSADATDVDVVSMVNSISGILGGNYSMNTSGSFDGPTGAAWQNPTTAPITNPGIPGATPSYGVSGALNNPSNASNQLYGSGGLLNGLIGDLPSSLTGNPNTDQLGIYSLSAANSLEQILQGNAAGAYGARTAFGGVSAANNILSPNTAITNNYFNISNQGPGNTASVKGALTASQIGTAYTTNQVNALAGGVYTNITQLTDAINTLSYNTDTQGSFTTYSGDLNTALGTISSVGGQFVSASSGLSTALSGLSSVLGLSGAFGTTDKFLFQDSVAGDGTGTTYKVASGALNTLSAINQINSDIAGGGIALSATKINPNYVTLMTTLQSTPGGSSQTFVQDLQIIADSVLNTPLQDVSNSNAASTSTAAANLNAVLTALSNLSGSQTAANLQTALQGLVNPNTNYTSGAQKINNNAPMGSGYQAIYNAYTAVAAGLGKLQTVFGTSNLGDTLIKALEVNNLLSTASSGLASGASLTGAFTAATTFTDSSISATGLGQLFNAFGNGSSSSYASLTTLLDKLAGYLNTNGVDTTASSTSDNVKAGNGTSQPVSGTTVYPITGPAANNTNTSWITTRISNQSSYNSAYNTALGQLLGYAMSYNTNSTALGKMLSSSSLLGNILTQGINNAAANVMFNSGAQNDANGQADAANNQAQQLNNIQAIFHSEDLLNSYVGAITRNYSNSPISVQQAQASALNYLYNALNAGVNQDGLIAQTKAAIASALNNNFVASNLPVGALKIINAMGPSMFEPSATKAQIAGGLNDLNNALGNFTLTASASALSSLTAGQLPTVFANISDAQTLAKSVVLIDQLTAGTSFNLANVLTSIIGTSGRNAQTVDAAVGTSLNTLPAGAKSSVITLLGVLTGARASVVTDSTKFAGSPIGRLIHALNTGVGGKTVAFENSATSASTVEALIKTAKSIQSDMTTVIQGLNVSALTNPSQANAVLGYLRQLPTLAKEIGAATGVSARQNFLDGKLTVADISSQIQALKAQIANYENMGTNTTGKAGLNIGLSSLLGSSISSVQNLGFADAAVNTLNSQLSNALPLLVGGNSSSFNISTVQGLVADLNKAVGTLYSGTNANNLFNNGVVQTISNMNNSTVTVNPNTFGLGGGGTGLALNTNGTHELTNLANLNTINSLLSGGILTSNAISTSYNGAFGTQSGSNNGFAGAIATTTNASYGSSPATAYKALTNPSYYNSGTTLVSVINALLPIGQQLSSGAIDASTASSEATKALASLISGGSTNAGYVWAAYQGVMGISSSATSPVAGLNNLLSTKQDLSTASGIAQVIQDANSLITANHDLISVVGGLSGSNVLTVGGANTINSATNLSNAIAAATALGNLLAQINPADLTNPVTGKSTAVTSATTVINAINSYNHNVQLLNNLTDGNGAKIAGDVIAYLQGNTSYNSLTGNSVGTTAINNLQNLLNRYEYLQGLQSQVQAAIANNPYALIMQQNQVLKSDGYQEAAKALVSTTGADANTGLFNVATSSTISPGTSTTFDLNNTAFTNLSTTVSNDIANAQAWNSYLTNLNSTSNSILSAPTFGGGTQAAADLNNIASSIYNLAGYFTPAAVSDNKVVTTALTSSINGALGAYNAINTALGALTTSSAAHLNLSGNLQLSNITTTGTGSGFNTTAATGATAITNLTFLNVAQSIVDVAGMLTPVSGQTNGLTNNQAGITAVTAVMGTAMATGSSATIQGTAGGLVTIFHQTTGSNIYDMNGALPSGMGSGNADGLTSMNQTAVNVVGGLVKALEGSSTLAQYLASPSTFATAVGTTPALLTDLTSLITPVLGKDNAEKLTSGTIAQQFLENLNQFVGQGGALQSLNATFKQGVRVGVPNFNSPNFTASVDQMLKNALAWNTNYDNALRAVKDGGQLGGSSGSGAISSDTVYNAINSIVQNANALFNSQTASGASNSGALATATQALVQYGLDNGLSSASPNISPIPTSAAGAGTSLAGLMAFYLASDMGLITSSGTISNPSFNNIATLMSAATPAQLAQAAAQVLANSSGDFTSAMQQTLLNTTLGNMLNQAQTYSQAATGQTGKSGLSGLLNSKTTIQDVLQTAIANAASMHNLNGVLNPASGVAVSKGQLSTTSINTINKLLGAMTTANGNLPTINPNTPVGAEAKMLLGMLAANNAASSALTSLAAVGGATSDTAQTYFQNVTTLIDDQATLLAKQSSTVVQLLEGMTQAVANSTSTDQQAQSAFGALKAVYTQIASPTINYTSAMNNLIGVIHQLENLQQSLVNQLAANQGQPGVNTASVDGLGTLVAKVQAEQKGFSDPNSLTPQQVEAAASLLGKIQSALIYAKAAQLKMSQMLANRGITYAASHMPMQTMNSNGNMYGIDVQFGYKQFFGKKKRWGVRYYANFSYQHGTFMTSDASELDNFVYGAGVDALYNFYESKDGKYTSGLFAGLMLEGSSWAVKGQSYYQAMMNAFNATGGHATMNTSYFQIPINIGFRTNVNKHNGFEIGLRIPLATNYYFKGVSAAGQKLDIAYKRNVSVFFNYVYNF
ncbi:outer membrane protein [Helicobacter ailurogastricus]|uniref:Uncharacterized protein n=1 Tax=Helicobacter ailurogastricus TaxID=1578720 RepID=A0A0K2Y2P8_9HELI|nr:outer membrane protein [Helicobacter ailurogastricus]BDQ29768.1 hypothetical protein ASB7_16050 [Helicobacter ailurogastricus]CRF52592.1 hypothetical protein HAL07_10570 [Helicobacter ailurogastricus]